MPSEPRPTRASARKSRDARVDSLDGRRRGDASTRFAIGACSFLLGLMIGKRTQNARVDDEEDDPVREITSVEALLKHPAMREVGTPPSTRKMKERRGAARAKNNRGGSDETTSARDDDARVDESDATDESHTLDGHHRIEQVAWDADVRSMSIQHGLELETKRVGSSVGAFLDPTFDTASAAAAVAAFDAYLELSESKDAANASVTFDVSEDDNATSLRADVTGVA